MMIEHASRCVFVFYDLLKLLCELLLFKYFKLLKLRNNLHANYSAVKVSILPYHMLTAFTTK